MTRRPSSPRSGKDSVSFRTTRKLVERVLSYLSKQQTKTCWSGTAEDSDHLSIAWWTVWFAGYQDSPSPYDAALRKVLGPRYRESRNVVPAIYTGPDSQEPADLDGRSGYQWVQSVLSYLDWRAGLSWRPARERNHPERVKYVSASLELRQAFFNTPNRPPGRSRGTNKQFIDSETQPLKKRA